MDAGSELSPVSPLFPPWPPDWPEIADSISQAVARGDWGRYRGKSTDELTRRISEMCSTNRCRLISSGSAGVELALRAVGISPGDQVVLCGYDYPGNFRAIELLGARPLLVDASQVSYSVDPEQLKRVVDRNVKAVVVSHLYGIPAEISAVREICDHRGWKLIEDACQTPGMTVDGRNAGSWGDVAVLSFGGSKPLTAGNGGAIVTNDDAIASKWNAWIDRPSDSMPMSELQAAAVLPQLRRLGRCNQIRWETICTIFEQVRWMADAVGNRRPNSQSTCYKLAFLSQDRDSTLHLLSEKGLPVGPGYRSMHRSSDRRCGKIGTLDACRLLGEQLCVLDHAALLSTGDQRDRLIDLLS